MDMPEGAEGHSVANDGVRALIEGLKVAISRTRLYLDGAPRLTLLDAWPDANETSHGRSLRLGEVLAARSSVSQPFL